jgi:hypothetical protein
LFTGENADESGNERPIFRCLAAGDNAGANENSVLAAGDNADTNKKSILAVIHWPAAGRCSLYTGGDGNPQAAKEFFEALFKTKSLPSSGRRVKAMKLDHHGSTLEFNTHLGEPNFEEVRGRSPPECNPLC